MTLNLLGISGAMLSPLQKIGEKTHCYLDNFNLTTFPKSQTLGLVGCIFKTTIPILGSEQNSSREEAVQGKHFTI